MQPHSFEYGPLMDKVLIVENHRSTLEQIRSGFRDLHHFELLTASSAKIATDILTDTRIAVLATGIHLPQGDGLDLLGLMTRKHPSTPCIAILEKDDPKPWFIDRTGHTGVLYYLKKPFSFSRLASAIFVGLNLRDEGQTRNGVTMTNFLPLLAIARKTCRMDIKSGTRQKGICYLERGQLLNARTAELEGDAAAKQIAQWRGIQLSFSPLADKDRQVRTSIDLLTLAKATWEKGARPADNSRATSAYESGTAGRIGSKLEDALHKHAGILRSAKGYKGLAIVSSNGEVLANDTSHRADIDFSAIAEMANQIYTDCSRHLSRKGLGRCRGLSLDTEQGILLVHNTDMYTSGNFRFLALMAEDGNCFFIQTQLKTIIPKILSEVAMPGGTQSKGLSSKKPF
ncbi:MAG: response regulator [Desulfobacterales bacterium]|nr:response regulator [Desulfobacterales bacterium]